MKNSKLILENLIFCLTAAIFCLPVSAQRVTQIAAGGGCYIKSDGSLWGMGFNVNGELGDGTTNNSTVPEKIVSSGVAAVARGWTHTLFVKSDGSLWAMGDNTYGQLGDGTTNQSLVPKMIVSNGVVAVAAGAYTSFFIRSDGSLWAMGLRSDGNLADGTTNDFPWNNYTNTPESLALVTQRTPELIVSNGVTAVNLSSLARVYFWKNDGSLWGAGANWEGELTPGGAVEYYSPVPVAQSNVVAIAGGFYFSVFLKSDETLWKVGWTWWQPDETPNIIATDVVSSAAYGDNDVNDIFFIKSDGSLWGMGDNAEGQLGDGTTAEHTIPFEIVSNGVVAVATIGDETWFLKSDGSLWGMGWNGYGDLGDGTTIQRDSPVLIVPPPPVIINLNVAGTDLIFQGTNGMAGRDYSVLMSTNLAPSSNAWLPITTNMLVTDGGFTITVTNAFNQNVPPHFYTLRLNQ